MFSTIRHTQELFVTSIPNTINSYAEVENAKGLTPNRVADSNEMAGNNHCAPAFTYKCPLPLADAKAAALA